MASISNRVYTPQDPISHRGKTAVSSVASATLLYIYIYTHIYSRRVRRLQIPPAGHGIDADRDRVTLSKKIRKMSAGEKRRKSFPATAARPAAEPQFSWGTEQRQDLYARSDSTSIPIHPLSHGSYVVLHWLYTLSFFISLEILELILFFFFFFFIIYSFDPSFDRSKKYLVEFFILIINFLNLYHVKFFDNSPTFAYINIFRFE